MKHETLEKNFVGLETKRVIIFILNEIVSDNT